MPRKKARRSIQVVVILFLSIVFLIPSLTQNVSSLPTSTETIVSKVSKQLELPAGSDYYIKFSAVNLTLNGQDIEPYAHGLSETVLAAIAKAPQWIQYELTRQFHTLNTTEEYAALLLNASRRYADEIAFCIACSPQGNVPSAALIYENVQSLYERDQWIQYAEIVDYDDGAGNYYSTIRYTVLENGEEKQVVCPPEIYYWYVVHPKLGRGAVDPVYGTLWRSYLFDHNDLGYPLLKEKLSSIQYLWDCESYYQTGNRLWTTCINQHPTAIEAISYWVGKTVPYQATGDRPNQPNIIAHEHNGWCGELQVLAVAAQRAALVPSIATYNVGEDHVWREFFERGWHENDNWWSDTGGAVDEPDVYAYGWGKNMSAIYTWRGDDTIADDTSRYIHPEDRITATFIVKDGFLHPVDGARITVLVIGLKDITWYKNMVWGKIQDFWDKLPEFLKGKLLNSLFGKLQERYEQIPDVVNGVTITTWNYTNLDGTCSFELGKNCEYLFLIQQGNLKKPWQLARHNSLRILRTHTDKTFHIILSDVSVRIQRHTQAEMPEGDCQFHVMFATAAYQPQQDFSTGGIGMHEPTGRIDCFFVDQENFDKYKSGKTFECYNYSETQSADVMISARLQDWYLIFRNHARLTHVMLNFSVDVDVDTQLDLVQIVTPDTTLFDTSIYNIGDTIFLSGVATDDVYIVFRYNENITIAIEIPIINNHWSYLWNTSGKTPGSYLIEVDCHDATDYRTITLIDAIPPTVSINEPNDGTIVEDNMLFISGQSADNLGVDHVDVAIDGQWRPANGTTSWNLSWDISGLALGDHTLSANVVDTSGLSGLQMISFVVNESGHTWGPDIIQLSSFPEHPTNISNMIIYANVTTTSPFALNTVVLFCDNGTGICSYEMYRYADYPIQSRHEEDPLKNESNSPLYGTELGQFPTGTTITYWIIATDTAHNTQQSETTSFTIE